MDTSVNMKMSPDEHRLLRSAVEKTRDAAELIVLSRDADPADRRSARELVSDLNSLLAKI